MSTDRDSPPEPDRGTHRLEGFSDAFFAIVITLLVLDLRLPEQETPDIALALRDAWTVGLAYVVSFINIYIIWVSHHELIRITTRADTRFLYLNGAFLLGIGVMPFSTAVLADYFGGEGANAAAAIYTGAFLWVTAFLNFIWRYLAAHPDRLLPSVTRRDRRRISRTYFAAVLLYACAFALAWWRPVLGIAITLALGVFFAVIDRISGFASEDIANEDEAVDGETR